MWAHLHAHPIRNAGFCGSFRTAYPIISTAPDQFISFAHAMGQDSRACLDTTLEMLMLVFSICQVMPEFLDFLFLFGYQTQAEDLYFSGFREKTRLTSRDRGTVIPSHLRSGYELQVCYSLKSVEQSVGQPHWPWSIRQCATHHTFDVKSGRAEWIIIKGNKEIAKRVRSATGNHGPNVFSSFDDVNTAFSAALYIHLIICEWSAENWRWYIKFLEQEIDRLTQGAITTNADVSVSVMMGRDPMVSLSRSDTQQTQRIQKNRIFSFPKSLSRSTTQAGDHVPLAPIIRPSRPTTFINQYKKKQPLPPGMKNAPTNLTQPPVQLDESGQQTFKFADLQKIQNLEEKANETILVLRLNLNVMWQLKNHYADNLASYDILKPVQEKCASDLDYLRRRIQEFDSEMNLQILRVDALLRRLTDRKALVSLFHIHITEIHVFNSCTVSSTIKIHKSTSKSLLIHRHQIGM